MGVSYDRKGHVATLTIEGRTDMNLFAPDTVYLPLYDAFMEYEQDEEAFCAILTAVGTKAFSAGGDLKAYERLEKGYQREVDGLLRHAAPERSLSTLIHGNVPINKPMIFAVNGFCLGAAMIFTMHYADMVYAVPHATFGLVEIKWAIGGGGGTILQRFFPLPVAMELYLTGRLINAQECFDHGFVNHIVEPKNLIDEATSAAERIAAMPPLHARRVKGLMRADRENTMALSRQMERYAGGGVPFDHPDNAEGVAAFLEDREPRWVGDVRKKPKVAGVFD